MSFKEQMRGYADGMEQRKLAQHNTTVEMIKQSWQFGSPLTGSPGVPVETSNLRNSIMREDVSPTESIVATNVEYAIPIEDGIGPHGPMAVRSAVGGFHALGLTLLSASRIVDAAAKAHA